MQLVGILQLVFSSIVLLDIVGCLSLRLFERERNSDFVVHQRLRFSWDDGCLSIASVSEDVGIRVFRLTFPDLCLHLYCSDCRMVVPHTAELYRKGRVGKAIKSRKGRAGNIT